MTNPLEDFLTALDRLPWLARAGATDDLGVVRVASLSEALSGGYPDSYPTWSGHSHGLEEQARAAIGDDAITVVFDTVQARIREPLWRALGEWTARAPDNADHKEDAAAHVALSRMLSDVSWAAVEWTNGWNGFFTMLFGWYAGGHWPCAWVGPPYTGRLVVF
jgi:hypothetical protein